MKRTLLLVAASSLLAQAPLPTAKSQAALPTVDLPDGLELVVAAAPPLVNHPIMGCVDDRGRLFIGDAAGVNLDKAGLEEQLPNRVVLLEDTDGNGTYDKSTVFADKMTFPQGALWLDGSLYVASPPGIWKLTDVDNDGVAEEREMIVGGFEYTGNAADVHGPFLHPNGRLYWLHGRKGHKVVQKDGTLVHEGLASGVWSCEPDGSDIQWHALASADNPTEIDFTPEGEIIGTVNIMYREPRRDMLTHWLYGGVYERPDQLQAVAGLTRTLKRMPMVYNFGHVAVSGCTFYRSGQLNPEWQGDIFVVHFNTQKLLRMKLTRSGATYEATAHDFLKLHDPGAHLTDVMEDADGSLIVLDTGGWFRIGCSTSLIERPDLKGAVYRIKRKDQAPLADPYGLAIRWDRITPAQRKALENDPRWMVRRKAARLAPAERPADLTSLLAQGKPHEQLRACDAIAQSGRLDARDRAALLELLGRPLDSALEHGAMYAGIATKGFTLADLERARNPRLVRRLMLVLEQVPADPSVPDALLAFAKQKVDSPDAELAHAAVQVAARHPRAVELSYDEFRSWLRQEPLSKGRLDLITTVVTARLEAEQSQRLLSFLLHHNVLTHRQTAWRILAAQSSNVSNADWLPLLDRSLEQSVGRSGSSARATVDPNLALLLDAIATLQSDHFDPRLKAIVNDGQLPQFIRLKALSALLRPSYDASRWTPSSRARPLDDDSFSFLLEMADQGDSATTRIEAARLLASSRLEPKQMQAIAPLLSRAGPVELRSLLLIVRRSDEESGRAFARSLARSPVLGSIDVSIIRTNFSRLPVDVYEGIVAPAVRDAEAAIAAKQHNLQSIASAAVDQGRAVEGRNVFESGKGACIACHRVGEKGRDIGPDLSHIGRIRTERDLVEAILFPSATLAREFEPHVIETANGETLTGMIRSRTAEGLLLLDLAGQEHNIRHDRVVAESILTTSLMPVGLEQAMTDQELFDLVAWLASLDRSR